MKMELFVADADGKNTKQITNFGCASFAPTFTPDGKQLLFASNKHACDSSKFELYMINVDGTGLKQVTNYGGFTSFPEFSPDGSKLVFVSDWKARGAVRVQHFHRRLEALNPVLVLDICRTGTTIDHLVLVLS